MNRHYLYDFLVGMGWNTTLAWYIEFITVGILLFILAWLIGLIIKRLLNRLFKKIALSTKTHFDDYLLNNNFPTYISRLVPYFFLITLIPFWGFEKEQVTSVLYTIFHVYGVFLILWVVKSLLKSIRDYLKTLASFNDKPIDSYIQVFMIIAWIIGGVIILSLISGRGIGYFLTAMGALSAVILLIFKDTILGFVASIQIAANDLVRIGDWVTMEKYGADGDVIEINLSTVKIQNFDKTISTIPTYNLITDSFKNWRGMAESTGRRIKRSILIKTSSIRFFNSDELNELQSIERISYYLKSKAAEIEQFNVSNNVDKSLTINGRNLTNIGLFRTYIEQYLYSHPKINAELTIMCRQLPTTSEGTPLEVYAFCSDKIWKNYEHISADIFDHLIAAVRFFDLECFELQLKK